MNKIQIICDKNLEQDDFSYCFHNSLIGNGDVISNFINRMKKVKNMTGIFESSDINNLQFLRSIPMNNGMITDYAFKDCIKIQSANNMTIGSNVKSAIGSFKGCTGIKTMTGLQINMSGPISNFAQGCTSLTTITGTVKNVTNMDYMFKNCSSLISLDLSGFNKILSNENSKTFSNCTSLIYLDISNIYFDLGTINHQLQDLIANSNLITTINLYGASNPAGYTFPTPSNGKITLNYTSDVEAFVDQIILEHPEYNWVKGKLITAPTSS